MRVNICRTKDVKRKIVAIALSILCVGVAVFTPIVVHVVNENANVKTVVIDAGHGGEDGGVSGVRTGVKESDLNLKISKLVGECLMSSGFRVVYTRTNDTMRTHPKVQGNKKRADMFARGDIINDAKPHAVVSIHMNFYSSSSRRGAQVFFDDKKEGSVAFADIMQDMLNRNINSLGNGRAYSALRAKKYLLSCSPYPTVIVECGFLSNPFDEQNLVNPQYQLTLAETIYQGIIIFLQQNCQ